MNKYSNDVSIVEICFIATGTSEFLNFETFLTDYSDGDFNAQKSKVFELYEALISAINISDIKVISHGKVAIHNPYPCQYYRICKQSIARWFLSHSEVEIAMLFYPSVKELPPQKSLNINESSNSKEIRNLQKTLGVALSLIIDRTQSNALGTIKSPNCNAISKKLEAYLPKDSYGLSDRALRQRIKEALSAIND